jgi:hypothetical protein
MEDSEAWHWTERYRMFSGTVSAVECRPPSLRTNAAVLLLVLLVWEVSALESDAGWNVLDRVTFSGRVT